MAGAQLSCRERAVGRDVRQQRLEQLRTLLGDPPHAAPGVVLGVVHPPPQQGLGIDRQQARLVTPVLEEQPWSSVRRTVEQVGRIRAEPAVQRKVVRPGEHVDRVDLEQASAGEHPPQRAPVRCALGQRIGEPLRRERHPTRLSDREGLPGARHGSGA